MPPPSGCVPAPAQDSTSLGGLPIGSSTMKRDGPEAVGDAAHRDPVARCWPTGRGRYPGRAAARHRGRRDGVGAGGGAAARRHRLGRPAGGRSPARGRAADRGRARDRAARPAQPGPSPRRAGRPGGRPGQRQARPRRAGHHAPLRHRAARHRHADPDAAHPGRGAQPRGIGRPWPRTRRTDRRGRHRQARPDLGLPPGRAGGQAGWAGRACGGHGTPSDPNCDHAWPLWRLRSQRW